MVMRFMKWVLLAALILNPGISALAADGALKSTLVTTLQAIQAGKPDLSRMEPLTAAAVEQQMGNVQPILQQMGQIQTATFLGLQTMPGGSGEAYRVKFEHGSMLWVISESSAGKIQILWTQGPEAQSPASNR